MCVHVCASGRWPPGLLGWAMTTVPPSPANLRALLPGHHPHRHQPARGSAYPPQDQGSSRARAGLGKLPGSHTPAQVVHPCPSVPHSHGPVGSGGPQSSSSDSGPLGPLGFSWVLPALPTLPPRNCSPPTPSPRSPAGAVAAPTSTWRWGAWPGAAACCVRPLW